TEADTEQTVTRSTALGRTTTYHLESSATGSERQVVTFPDGTRNQLLSESNQSRTLTLRDGTVVNTQVGPDPRFGMQTPIPKKHTITTPGGLPWDAAASRPATLSAPEDPLSLTDQTDQVTVNGRTYTRVYSAATRTFTLTSPAGRQRTATLDARGRVIEAAWSGVTPVQISYDERGRIATLAHGSRIYSYDYDGQGRLSLLTDPLLHSLSFVRDAA